MKKNRKLGIKKVTLRDLDAEALDSMAGGLSVAPFNTCGSNCVDNTCLPACHQTTGCTGGTSSTCGGTYTCGC
jgi:hypothetical protein